MLEEHDPTREPERTLGTLLGENDRRAELDRLLEKPFGAVGIELRRRFVEQQQLRLERERRRKAHALKLPARQLGHGTLGKLRDPDPAERAHRSRNDPRRCDSEVLEPERHLGENARQDDLILGILENGCDRADEIRRTAGPRIASGDPNATAEPPAVKVRDESRERAQQRRLARAGRSEQKNHFAGLDRERDVPHGGLIGAGIRERQAVGLRYSHIAPTATSRAAATSAHSSATLHPGLRARVRPGRP